MIASLRGPVIAVGLDHAVIECSGVGYRFTATPLTLSGLRRGEEATVLTSLVVKEDSMTLYGFTDDGTREMFHLLQTVTGLGPRLALASQSVLTTPELSQAIGGGDAKALQRIPGVGKRMADRMVVELKDKVAAFAPEPGTGADDGTTAAPLSAGAEAVAEQVTEALIGLGFTERVAQPAVEGVLASRPELDTAAALRAALSELGRK
ncbi:Holliday junction branch migration protein RuvA [Corynebacterium halotolerans]|uniref:Holliday junction branch migration complex subunit RuvA n=1 Tax=Corynebacterium halotolerans YIM 70093 = DSM 44683 TaxID=1121362 RepID=M1MY09_9CORY|nr:Holliday junction branch migration protein RuvA [Corynebacterium halotolerans]AGF72619.1 Holliday junction DNA helicase RuvA [Corynebacterium halotolerans YIM 70093 = DSM 44683]